MRKHFQISLVCNFNYIQEILKIMALNVDHVI